MGYYWVTQAQRYIQSLGFGSTLPAVNKRQQLLRINQFGGDNSFYREGTGKLTITSARAASTTPRTPRSSSTSTATRCRTTRCPASARPRRRRHRRGLRRLPGRDRVRALRADAPTSRASPTGTRRRTRRRCRTACAASTATSTIRRTSSARSTPTARSGRVRCGTSTRRSGAKLADTIIIRAQFGFTPDISMPAAAAKTIATAGLYGTSAQRAVQAAFAARGLA